MLSRLFPSNLLNFFPQYKKGKQNDTSIIPKEKNDK